MCMKLYLGDRETLLEKYFFVHQLASEVALSLFSPSPSSQISPGSQKLKLLRVQTHNIVNEVGRMRTGSTEASMEAGSGWWWGAGEGRSSLVYGIIAWLECENCHWWRFIIQSYLSRAFRHTGELRNLVQTWHFTYEWNLTQRSQGWVPDQPKVRVVGWGPGLADRDGAITFAPQSNLKWSSMLAPFYGWCYLLKLSVGKDQNDLVTTQSFYSQWSKDARSAWEARVR